MAGIYIHIPFCKQACHYCDFHFSTSLKHKDAMVNALLDEIAMRKTELHQPVSNIYFGGGTPSLLETEAINSIIDQIYTNFKIVNSPEITLEANPDDLNLEKLAQLTHSEVNRLSIGIQSFFERDLKLMNRSHTSQQAFDVLADAKRYFDNISADLIYGIPGLSDQDFKANISRLIQLNIPHISAYALTVEPHTALSKFIEKGIVDDVDDEQAERQFHLLTKELQQHGFDHYEFSNHGKPGYFSQNNIGYWTGKPYLGIGPAAHSFNIDYRSWNISNNVKYIKAIKNGEREYQGEKLNKVDQYNEYIMTRLRTKWGIDMNEVEEKFGVNYTNNLIDECAELIDEGVINIDKNKIYVTSRGKFLSDGIASRLFLLNLDQPSD